MNGFIIVNKPEGWTSHDVVAKARGLLHTRAIGHLGTLDPFATGMLILAIGEATKVLTFLQGWDKTYRATLRLGSQTSTGDLTGDIIRTCEVPVIDDVQLLPLSHQFTGTRLQIPPMYSAKKVNGHKLVDLARRGVDIERAPVEIHIHDCRLTMQDVNHIHLVVRVSTGTYVRTLAEDIAIALGTCGHLVQLTRTTSGPWTLLDAVELSTLHSSCPIISIEHFCKNIPTVEIDEQMVSKAKNGAPLRLLADASLLFIATPSELLAVYGRDPDGWYRCRRGLGGIAR